MLSRYIKYLQGPALILVSVIAMYIAVRPSGDSPEFAVNLKPGTITLPEFQVNMEGQYEIVLAVERNLPRDDLDDLLGGQPTLNSPGSVVDLKWTLTSGNSIVASGSSRNEKGGGWGQYVYRTIGRFDGLPQTPYVLEVNILRDGSALAPANPRIAVWLAHEEVLDKITIPRMRAACHTLIAVIGILCLWTVMGLLFRGNPDKDVKGDAPQAEN
ncbi:MAG: hypothetical protein GXY07_03885 [Candidatus Hydrogenedentes bacterium]|nr:hypothetical protein [Candidatus Hydrogenedentota bacterium]